MGENQKGRQTEKMTYVVYKDAAVYTQHLEISRISRYPKVDA